MGRREDNREGDADEPEGRADRQVDVLVDDDEGHADGHDAVAGGIAQQRVQRVGGAEEGRIDQGAAEIEQRHEGKQARFPAADELRRWAAARHCSADSHEIPM